VHGRVFSGRDQLALLGSDVPLRLPGTGKTAAA
jgi:hypothetical protein